MTRKRYVKLLMGKFKFDKRSAKYFATVNLFVFGSYKKAWAWDEAIFHSKW